MFVNKRHDTRTSRSHAGVTVAGLMNALRSLLWKESWRCC